MSIINDAVKLYKRILVSKGVLDDPYHRKEGDLPSHGNLDVDQWMDINFDVNQWKDVISKSVGRVIEDTERKTFIEGDAVLVSKWGDLRETGKSSMNAMMVLGDGENEIFIVDGYAFSSAEYCPYCLQKTFIDQERNESYCPACDQ